MNRPAFIKTSGYGISTLSVILLGASAWKNASINPVIAASLFAGMAASIIGMEQRWWSYRLERRYGAHLDPASFAAGCCLAATSLVLRQAVARTPIS